MFASERIMYFRVISFVYVVTYLVIVTATLSQGPGLYQIMQTAFSSAHRELERQRFLNEKYLALGIDDKMGKTRSGSATSICQLNTMFHHNANTSLAQSDQSTLGLLATQELANALNLPFEEMQSDQVISTMFRKFYLQTCRLRQPLCNPKMRYRTYDGSCNNLQHPTWGMSNRPQKRYLPPAYNDGISTPRFRGVNGQPLSSARVIGNVIHRAPIREMKDKTNSIVLMQFGAVVTHDMVDTPGLTGAREAEIDCCNLKPLDAAQRLACFTIPIPQDDHRFRNPCMNFVRSTSGTEDTCSMGRREQLNQRTPYLDHTLLFGSDEKEANQLRTHFGGQLVMNEQGLFGEHEDANLCMKRKHGDYCMKSGNRKMHSVPTLTSLSVLFLRQHNLMAKHLGQINPQWNDETLFQETRKIMIALLQNVIYKEFLPIFIGDYTMTKYQLNVKKRGFNTVYDPSVDATLANGFVGAAYRFAHTMVPGIVGLVNKYKETKTVPMEFTYNKPTVALKLHGKGVDWLNRWMLLEKSGKPDRFLEKALTDNLFLDEDGNAFDMSAINIQRGRDHGLPGYNQWRHWCGLSKAFHFHTGYGGLIDMDAETAKQLSQVYSHPDDIDIYTGGLAEMLLPGAKTGPTFACIIGRQFRDLKFGDRFWYENNFPRTGFTEAQLNSIKSVGLSRAFCDGSPDQAVQSDVFNVPSPSNPSIPCSEIPSVDLRLWQDSNYQKPFY